MKKQFKQVRASLARIGNAARSRWKLLLFIVVVAGVGGSLWYRSQLASVPNYTFVSPEVTDLTSTLDVSGVVDAKQKARMRFAAGGKVTYLGAQEGDTVKKWQTIAAIDKADLQKRLQKDLNTFMQERWDWEQLKDDEGEYDLLDLETRRTIDKAQWDLNNTVLDVEIRDLSIRDTNLTAPFEGVLIKSPTTTTGVSLLATDVFELVNPDSLVFRAEVDESDISQVLLNMRGSITLDAYPDTPIESAVSYISYTSEDTSSGTVFIVEFPISGENLLSRYRLGMNGDVAIKLKTVTNVLSVPLESTIERDDVTYVQVKTGEHSVEERAITTGLETDDRVEVISGLSKDDLVVIPERE